MVGDVIVAYKNGVPVGHAVDTTYTAGNPGMGFNLENRRGGLQGNERHLWLHELHRRRAAMTTGPVCVTAEAGRRPSSGRS